jgi:hypothetical protein
MRRAVVVLALALAPATVASAQPVAASSKSCSAPKYPGSGYFTSLSVKGTGCAKGRKVALAHYNCRTKHGKKGKCSSKVLGYQCTEKRVSIPTEYDSKVTCKNGAKRVIFTYQQNL